MDDQILLSLIWIVLIVWELNSILYIRCFYLLFTSITIKAFDAFVVYAVYVFMWNYNLTFWRTVVTVLPPTTLLFFPVISCLTAANELYCYNSIFDSLQWGSDLHCFA